MLYVQKDAHQGAIYSGSTSCGSAEIAVVTEAPHTL